MLVLASVPLDAAQARVFVLGVDGGSWNVIDPMLAAGELPHLSALIARGVHANLETVEPLTSPVVWTSIATGRRPESHGVTDFYATRLTVRTPSVFERLAASGLRVGLYDFLMTWPPVDLPGGFVIPGWLRRDETVSPHDVWSRIDLAPYVNDYATAKTSQDYLSRAQRDVLEKVPRLLALARAFELDVAATTIYAVDMTSHRFWHGVYPDDFEPRIEIGSEAERTAVRDAVRGVDASLGELVSAMGPEDTVILLSDHGFEAREDGPRNVWVTRIEADLALAGLDPQTDSFSLISAFGTVAFRVHPVPEGSSLEVWRQRDAVVDRLVALLRSFQTADGEPLFGALESIDGVERPAELQRSWLTQLRQWVVSKAIQYLFGVNLDGKAHTVIFTLPDDDVLAALWPDGIVQVGGRQTALRELMSRQVFTGGHHETAIFLAAGQGVRHEAQRGNVSVLDIASLLFYLSDQAIPDDLEGRLPVEILDPARLAQSPPRTIPAAEAPGLGKSGTTEAIEDPALVEKLRALGYVE